MNKRAIFVLLIIGLLASAFPAFAQTTPNPFEPIGTPANPNAAITFPPPIYLLRGAVDIRGTAAVQGQAGYYLEFRPLQADFTSSEDNAGWSPATLPVNAVVNDDILGTWDTTVIPDGAYELRLTIIQSSGNVFARVSPLRVENEPPPFVIVAPPTTVFVATQQPLAPAPTAIPAGTNGTALADVNVRRGDSTAYERFTFIRSGETVPIVGISSTGTGWYVIQLPDGRQGYVAPNTLRITGRTAGLPFFTPPPPPATPTPALPTAAPTSTLPDGTITSVRFDRAIRQGEAFQVIITVFNGSATGMGPVVVACNFRPQNAFFSAQLPGLGAFTQQDVSITARLDSGAGTNTTADCAIDLNNLIPELNEGNNFFNITALLAP